MDVIKFVAATSLAPAAAVLRLSDAHLVEVELAILKCKLELSELVGPCLEVASSGFVEASRRVRV